MACVNNIIEQSHLTDTYKIFHTTNRDYALISAAHGGFSKTIHIIENKAKIELLTLSDNGIIKKLQKYFVLSNTFLN